MGRHAGQTVGDRRGGPGVDRRAGQRPSSAPVTCGGASAIAAVTSVPRPSYHGANLQASPGSGFSQGDRLLTDVTGADARAGTHQGSAFLPEPAALDDLDLHVRRRPPRAGPRQVRQGAWAAAYWVAAGRADRGWAGQAQRPWGVDDMLLEAGPAEVESAGDDHDDAGTDDKRNSCISAGNLVIDEPLLGPGRRPAAGPHLQGVRAAQAPGPAPRPGLHPGPAAGVWGYDYFGGTRTVDVHMRAWPS